MNHGAIIVRMQSLLDFFAENCAEHSADLMS